MTAKTIDKSVIGREVELHSYAIEASDIGLAPGEWPVILEVTPKLGNGMPFYMNRAIGSADGEFGGYVYCQEFGCVKITVFND